MSEPGSRRTFLRFSAGAVAAAALWTAGAAPAFADEDLAEGVLLVADRRLQDPNFEHTVVLIINYDEQGTVGLVLNRPSEITVAQLLAGVKEAKDRTDDAFTGGPVEPMSVLALLRARTGPKGAQQVAANIWAILDQDALGAQLAAHTGADKLRFFVGYAGWGAGQLEAEVDAGAWRVIPATSAFVFDAAPESLWERATRTVDTKVARLQGPRMPALRSRL